jgi:hypothetical protein
MLDKWNFTFGKNAIYVKDNHVSRSWKSVISPTPFKTTIVLSSSDNKLDFHLQYLIKLNVRLQYFKANQILAFYALDIRRGVAWTLLLEFQKSRTGKVTVGTYKEIVGAELTKLLFP